jgi:hypothetical protein
VRLRVALELVHGEVVDPNQFDAVSNQRTSRSRSHVDIVLNEILLAPQVRVARLEQHSSIDGKIELFEHRFIDDRSSHLDHS